MGYDLEEMIMSSLNVLSYTPIHGRIWQTFGGKIVVPHPSSINNWSRSLGPLLLSIDG